ncbi:MAG: AAA family ATPase [Synechococcales bacterium]|nr:AAA family ATPase [Synechococcales bacterium]
MARLVLMIGLPGSGKTTLAAAIAQSCSPCPVVSTDAVRATLYGDEAIQGEWLRIWAEVERQLQEAPGPTTIYDATNAVRRHRRRAIARFRALGFRQIFGLWLDVPLVECLVRNQGRSRQVPEAVIQRMARCLQNAPPALGDGLDALVRYQPLPSAAFTPIPQPNRAGVEIATPPPQ